MNRSRLNYALDALSLVLMLALALTGLLIRFALPPGREGGRGLELAGWTRHQWGDFHFWLAVALVGLVVAHLALHWRWICNVTAAMLGRSAPRTQGSGSPVSRYAAIVLLALVVGSGGLFLLGLQNVTVSTETGRGRGGWAGQRKADSAPLVSGDDACESCGKESEPAASEAGEGAQTRHRGGGRGLGRGQGRGRGAEALHVQSGADSAPTPNP